MSKKQSTATKRANAQRAAERAAALRKQHEAKERRRRTLTVSLLVIGALALIVAIVAAVQAARDTTGETATPPQGAVDSYALPLGPDSAPVTVEIYEDFLCPFCGQFESISTDMLKQYAEAGDVQVQYRMISILDDASSGTEYSTRAMNAVGVVLDEAGPEVAVRFHDLLFANQPAEGSEGLSDEELVDLAVEAGAEESAVRPGIESLAYEQWVKNATDQASKDGVAGTPTVVVDGEQVEGNSMQDLAENTEQAITDALGE